MTITQAQEPLALSGGAPLRQRPWPHWPAFDAQTEQILVDVLRSGRWAISGAYTGRKCYERQFAEAFAAYNGTRYCVPTTSGTASLTLALLGLGIGPGREVLVPGLTWVACASAVFSVGAVPVLVDIEPETLAMSPDSARAAITDRTAAIMIVHPFCRLADVDRFVALAAEFDLPLIEDCSQAHGATWRGRRVGTFGRVGCFSMQQSKVLTSGEGGAAITDDPELYARMEQLRSDGRLFGTTPRRGRLELLEVGDVQGQNMCLSEFQAAVLLDRLAHLDAENELRAERAAYLERLLGAVEGVRLLPRNQHATSYTYYNLLLEIDTARFADNSIDAIGRALGEELNVLAHPIYQPLNTHPLYNPLSSPRAPRDPALRAALTPARFDLPQAERARRRCLTLPHPVLLDDARGMHDIVAALKKIQDNASDLRDAPQGTSAEAF